MKWFLLVLVLLGGCVSPPAPAPSAPAYDDYAAWYRQAESAGKRVLHIDTQESLIAITVRRGGSLARLGHDHVVASRGLAGFVAPDEGRAHFHFRLDDMTVDEPHLRREAGFDNAELSSDAIDGTRRNMLRVLEADRFPYVSLAADRLTGAGSMLRLTIRLHGVTRTRNVPVQVENSKAGLTVTGTLRLLQSEFGITPMSILGGALQVQDQLDMRFRIVARPASNWSNHK